MANANSMKIQIDKAILETFERVVVERDDALAQRDELRAEVARLQSALAQATKERDEARAVARHLVKLAGRHNARIRRERNDAQTALLREQNLHADACGEIADLHELLNDTIYERNEARRALEAVRALFSGDPGGKYAITRDDGEKMWLGDAIEVGNVMERVDAALRKARGEAQP